MIKHPFETTVIVEKSIKDAPVAVGFHKATSEEQSWYESPKIFDLSDVIDFQRTYYKDIEPRIEAVEIESRYRYTFTIKCTFDDFKAAMKKAGMIK